MLYCCSQTEIQISNFHLTCFQNDYVIKPLKWNSIVREVIPGRSQVMQYRHWKLPDLFNRSSNSQSGERLLQTTHDYKEPWWGLQIAIHQKSLADFQEKLFNFQKYLNHLKIKRKHELNQVGNTNKMPVLFHITVSLYQAETY